MQIQKVQSNQTSFKTKVVITKDLNKMLKKRGYAYSQPFEHQIPYLDNNGENDKMTVFFEKAENGRHYVVGVRSLVNELGQVFVSSDSVKMPFLKNNHVASLRLMYEKLKQLPFKEVK